MKPFFSIIMACCNVEPYIREAMDSVMKQSFGDWECICGIEESKDRTEEILQEIAAGEPRIRIFTHPRSGSCSATRNIGIDMSRGKYVIFLDGDDTIADGCLARLYDRICAKPDADLYPCVILAYNEMTGEKETRDNYPADAPAEMSGTDATVLIEGYKGIPCSMLQMTVFRREFLVEHDLKCIYGLRRQDSEFSPRALYLAKRVVPLHEPFYLYRMNQSSVSYSARGAGYFHKDWAIILKSLLSFYGSVSREPDFDRRVESCWRRQWFSLLLYFWFDPTQINSIPRQKRLETLGQLFSDGFGDFNAFMKNAPFSKRVAGWWIRAFVRHSSMRGIGELFFKMYFSLSKRTTASHVS